MQKTKDDLLEILDDLGISYTNYDHEPVFTVEESNSLCSDIPGGHTKNLFLKDKKDNFFLVVLEEHADVDLKKIHTLIDARSRVSFGKPDKLLEYLGVIPGSVTAFAVMNDTNHRVNMVIDKPLLEHEIINCHPLQNDATTSIHRDDLIRFAKHFGHDPLILKISQ
ncbi:MULTISPECIES: prolyl-tRNA synthetase associated domain-containing protein [unclassified Lentilitoribacter]|jgi:Ala-tRNA(Pro) deacylase|uniref:prolyl-tRNA synthetase associated domain-containing protein n=1 Tax=unclassified Lentilitoribacter TaxID=2647570 RepID=UPI0013A6FA2A|nr:YbaK/EbsC family protein [Lentilitoribacter sp. Alg239-R112]